MIVGARHVPRELLPGLVLTLLGMGVAAFASPVAGQPFQPDPVSETTALVYWAKPFFPDMEERNPNGSVFGVDLVFPWRPGLSLQIGLPLSVAEPATGGSRDLRLGNLHVSALFGETGALSGLVGVTLSTASNPDGSKFPPGAGAYWTWDEPEEWSKDGLSIFGAVTPSWALSGGGRLGLRLGAEAARTKTDDFLLFGRAAGWGRFPVGTATLRADLSSSYLLNSDDGFGRQFTAYFVLGAELSDILAKPGLFVRVPLDGEARRFLDFAVGLSARL